MAAVTTAGSFRASLTPASAGTYYAWAQDSVTGLTAVSSAIAVSAGSTVTYGINTPLTGLTYTHGAGSIGVNGDISQAANTQVAVSTSNTTPPASGWQPALIIDNNQLWAIEYPVPATPGTYYIWVETSAGGSATVSSYTITVS
jgi:hypothetical protein